MTAADDKFCNIFPNFEKNKVWYFHALVVCLFAFILDIPVNNFQLCPGGSSWVEPELSKDKCVLFKESQGSYKLQTSKFHNFTMTFLWYFVIFHDAKQ